MWVIVSKKGKEIENLVYNRNSFFSSLKMLLELKVFGYKMRFGHFDCFRQDGRFHLVWRKALGFKMEKVRLVRVRN